jgi:nucleoside-diphosphate-sugar epimerase
MPGQTVVLAGSEVITTNAMVAHIGAAVSRTRQVLHVPLWPVAAAAVVFESTFGPLGLKPPLNRRRLDFFRKSFHFSTLQAERLLGFRAATDFAAGAAQTARWYRDQGMLGPPVKLQR